MASSSNKKMEGDKAPSPPHPFEKAFQLVEHLLKKIEDNKDKNIYTVPDWVLGEFDRLEGEIRRLKQTTERTFPEISELTDEQIKAALAAVPEEERTEDLEWIERAQDLKRKVFQAKQDYFKLPPAAPTTATKPQKSPLSLLNQNKSEAEKTQERQAEMERRQKFGRVGGRKNWRPM